MKFGKVSHPEDVNFELPEDHPDTQQVFKTQEENKPSLSIYIGCAKWNKQDLKNFYPKGTKDELYYYSRQFNSIELNATFYRIFPPEQFQKWKEKTPDNFKFFPKLPQEISHFKRLKNVDTIVDSYLSSVCELEEKLGTIFLQMHENFSPKDFHYLKYFVEKWPNDIPLSIELRHTDWYNDANVSNELFDLLKAHQIAATLVDTAGRRDLLHMRMTTAKPFIRWVGANHKSDYKRLDEWTERISLWAAQGMKELQFFIHQNMEEESPLLAAHFIQKINESLGINIKIPQCNTNSQKDLFSS